jgi:adenosylcobyric acid synthase
VNTRALMVMGTGSGVGKSWLCTGLCRLLARRGVRVAPFKAQNMANNAAVVEGGEIGRAQAVQAEAAGVVPTVDMNPILIKPVAHTRAQLVVLGQAVGNQEARDYWRDTAALWEVVRGAWSRLAAAYDVVVIEGAGSPAEFNLRDRDLVNMRMALHADARVLLVGDIDKGGVFASFLGTLRLLDERERATVAGFVINRFRGDEALLHPAPAQFAARTGIPVRGVLPMRRDIVIDREDDPADLAGGSGVLDVAAVRLPTISNFTDLEPLANHPAVGLRWVDRPEALGNPDLLVIPGAKDTLADLRWLRGRGLDRAVVAAAARTIPVLGICGGYQLLGESITDEQGTGGEGGTEPGLGLLPGHTRFSPAKRTVEVTGHSRAGWLVPEGLPIAGYEIHQGTTSPSDSPFFTLGMGVDGAVNGLVAGTYVHGLFDEPELREALVAALVARKGLDPLVSAAVEPAGRFRQRQYDALADLLEARLDLGGLGLPGLGLG